MKRLTISVVAVLMLLMLALPAQAHIGHAKTKQGTEFTGHNCVGGGCAFQNQGDGDLKMTNNLSSSRARTWWDFNVPAGHLFYASGSSIILAVPSACSVAGYESWTTSPSVGTVRLHIRINNIGSCTVKEITAVFISA